MPRSPGKVALHVEMWPEELQMVHHLAESLGYETTADFVRDTLNKAGSKHKVVFNFKVNRGGYRGRRTKSGEV